MYLARVLTMTCVVVVFFFYPASVQSLLEIFDCDVVDIGAPSNPLMVRLASMATAFKNDASIALVVANTNHMSVRIAALCQHKLGYSPSSDQQVVWIT